jgi:hypothetical protein
VDRLGSDTLDDSYLHKTSEYNEVAGTTDTLAAADAGTDIVYTSASAVTVTLPDTLAVGFQCTLTQAGAGTVTLSPTSDNLNGVNSDVDIANQWGTIWIMQYSEGNWIVAGAAV